MGGRSVSNTSGSHSSHFMQGIYWLLTIPYEHFTPYLPDSVAYIRGQLEKGTTTDYLHWQVLVSFDRSVRLAHVKSIFGDGCHAELSRSKAADAYVWKEETRIEGTQFELGKRKMQRNRHIDWEDVRSNARLGRLADCPPDVYVRYYNSLRRIAVDHIEPVGIVKEVFVFWGKSGTGKSRRAWDEATIHAYPKCPRSKFWDGYRSHARVIIDEFRGGIDISHMLRWTDRYPTIIEVKGSSMVLAAEKIWITSNLHPRDWYPGLDADTLEALLRRLTIVHFDNPFQ